MSIGTRIGTSHFNSFHNAVMYYDAYGYDVDAVEDKIEAGEISIGKPSIKAGEMLSTDNDGRYQIETI